MRDQYMRTGEAFLMVYSVDTKSSFDEIKLYWDQVGEGGEFQREETSGAPLSVQHHHPNTTQHCSCCA